MVGPVIGGRVTPTTARDAVITDDQGIAGHLKVILGALGAVVSIDRARIALRPGLIAALPVAAMLALGTIIGQPVGAVTMGAGAMLVGVAWRGDGPVSPPLPTMAVATVMLALSTAIGTITGRWDAVHVGVLFLFCLIAGLATAIGRRGAVVGTQTLIAFIVFGRFHESVLGGLRLAGLVMAGGTAQLLGAALIAAPLAWRHQRQALGAAYGQLARLARRVGDSGVRADEEFEAAEQALSTPVLFADTQRTGLTTLVTEGRRIRLELLVLGSSLARVPTPELTDPLEVLADALERIAATVSGADPARLEETTATLARWAEQRPLMPTPWLESRLAAIGGQVRAAARQALAVSEAAARTGRPLIRPRGRAGRRTRRQPGRGPLGLVVADLVQMRENASLGSIAGRHALRLAVVVAGTELLSQHLGLPRAYWMTVAAATVLRPSYAATFTRGGERVLGTVGGVVVATLIAVALNPHGWGSVAVVGILAALTYTVFSGSFALGVAGLTALVVFLLHTVVASSVGLAVDRGIDTVIGGAIGLAATLVWPTWSAAALPRDLSVLIGAQRGYLDAVLSGVLGGRAPAEATIAGLARHARVDYATADAALLAARGEPGRRADGLAPDRAGAVLAALGRISYAIHALRLVVAGPERPRPQLRELADGFDEALSVLARRLTAQPGIAPAPLPDLRRLLRAHPEELTGDRGIALDELVDAINSAAAVLGDAGPPLVEDGGPPSVGDGGPPSGASGGDPEARNG